MLKFDLGLGWVERDAWERSSRNLGMGSIIGTQRYVLSPRMQDAYGVLG